MKDIPNRLECAYCIRNYSHGGECRKDDYSDKGCLAFKADPRGCIRKTNLVLPVPLYMDVPAIDEWTGDRWDINGMNTEVCITHIRKLSWDTKRGYLNIHCRCSYYINEYSEDYVEKKEKPKLKLIK